PSGLRSISTNNSLPFTRALKIPAPSAPHANKSARSRQISVQTNARHAIPRASRNAGSDSLRDVTSTSVKHQAETGETNSSRCQSAFSMLYAPARNPTAEHQNSFALLRFSTARTAATKAPLPCAPFLKTAGTPNPGSEPISAGPHAATTG